MRLNNKISNKITQANVLLTLLIVWLHVSAYYDVSDALVNISIVSVPCFWAISSFLYFYSFDFSNPWESYSQKVVSRTKSLLIPFLLFSIFGFAFNVLAYHLHPTDFNPIEDFSNQSTFMYIYESKSNGPIWYLRSLFVFVLLLQY